MLHKIGTTKALLDVQNTLDKRIFEAALSILQILDREYGAYRDIEKDDGGIVLIVERQEELHDAAVFYPCLNTSLPEHIECRNGIINAMFLLNNEYSVHLLLTSSNCPEHLMQILEGGD